MAHDEVKSRTEDPADAADPRPERDERTGRPAAVQRMQQKAHWVDLQIEQAMERGDFDGLPGAGKPIKGLERNDPDWWMRGLIEREQMSGLLPPALALRSEDAELDGRLDEASAEQAVRDLVTDFNRRVIDARRQLQGGPPVITATRDVPAEVAAWRDRRAGRIAARRDQLTAERAVGSAAEPSRSLPTQPPRRNRGALRWFRR